jgi:hypothetical protein
MRNLFSNMVLIRKWEKVRLKADFFEKKYFELFFLPNFHD